MARFRITIEYDGGPFVGWQRQNNGFGVQHALEDALLGLTQETVTVFGAGRTDAGVHALGQVAHFDIEKDLTTRKVLSGINHYLKPHPISVTHAVEVNEDFNARFSAIERRYLYRILCRRARPALDEGRVWWVPQPLDVDAMADAAQVLIGRHDFTSFRATICQAKSAVKTLDELSVTQAGDEIHVRPRARSFLHHQVRNFVGTLVMVGQGKWTRDDVRIALEARDRAAAGPTAPPEGLYLTRVIYPDE